MEFTVANIAILFAIAIIIISILGLIFMVVDLTFDVFTGEGLLERLTDRVDNFNAKRKRKKHIKIFRKDCFKEGDKVKIDPRAERYSTPHLNFINLNKNKVLKINKIYYDKDESIGMVNISRAGGKYSYNMDVYDAERTLIKYNPMEVFEFDENLFSL